MQFIMTTRGRTEACNGSAFRASHDPTGHEAVAGQDPSAAEGLQRPVVVHQLHQVIVVQEPEVIQLKRYH